MMQYVCEVWCNVCASSAYAINVSNVRIITVCARKACTSEARASNMCKLRKNANEKCGISADICDADTRNVQRKTLAIHIQAPGMQIP